MSFEIRLVVSLNYSRLCEFAHVCCGVDEEYVEVLQDKVVRIAIAEQLVSGNAKQFDADAQSSFQVRLDGQGIAGETNPRGKSAHREDTNLEILRKIGLDFEASVSDAVQLKKYWALGGILPELDAAALNDVDEHLFEAADGILFAIPAFRSEERRVGTEAW